MTANSDTWNPRDDIDKYDYGEQAYWFRRLLWYCAGADVKLLQLCPQSERVKKEGIGGIVLATGGLAFISGSYAFYTVFSTGSLNSTDDLNIFAVVQAIIFGIMWAFVIFNLDRFIVSSVSHGDGTSKVTWGEIFQSSPRIFMAVMIGLCLSKPLEIRVMKSEINIAVAEAQRKHRETAEKTAMNEYLEEHNNIQAKIVEQKKITEQFIVDKDKKEAAISAQVNSVNREREGGVTGPGTGKAYQAAVILLEQLRADLAEHRRRYDEVKPSIDKQIRDLEAQESELMVERKAKYKIAEVDSSKLDGLVKRITLAHEEYPIPSTILSILLIIIEVSPIIFKMMLDDGPYDRLVENQKRLSQARYAIEVHSSIDTQTGKVVTHGETYHQANMLNNYEIGNLRVQSSATTKAQDAWLKDQLAEIEKNPHKYIKRDPEGSASS